MARIVFFESEQWQQDFVKHHFPKKWKHRIEFNSKPLELADTPNLQTAVVLCVFIKSKITAEIMDKLPNLRLIVTQSTGFDHIDVAYATQKGITVSNVPTYGDNTVAEHTFALLLSLARNTQIAFYRAKAENYNLSGLTGFDLKGKTIGIVGGGKIGMNSVKIARGFGMKVLVYDVRHDPFLQQILDFTYVDLHTLLKESDIVSLHAPYMPATHHLINMHTVKLLKKGVTLLNTSRGGLVETDALYYGLTKGIIARAGLDVLEEEELLFNHHTETPIVKKNREIIKMDNVLYTPHLAFDSKEALERIMFTTIENVTQFLNGNPVNKVK